MDENNNQKPAESQTPGAAIGSFIVIAILIAGAVYMLGNQLTKKPADLPKDENLNQISASSTEELPLSEQDSDNL